MFLPTDCVLTHNKIRTARLDQWPDPLTADDALAEAARKRAKEYIAYNCKLPEGTKPDPVRSAVALPLPAKRNATASSTGRKKMSCSLEDTNYLSGA